MTPPLKFIFLKHSYIENHVKRIVSLILKLKNLITYIKISNLNLCSQYKIIITTRCHYYMMENIKQTNHIYKQNLHILFIKEIEETNT